MNVYALPPLIVSVLSVLLGSFILSKNFYSRLNRFFFLESLAISIWLFSESIMYLTSSIEVAQYWARIAYLGVSFIPPFFYQMANAFIGVKDNKVAVKSLYSLAIVLLIMVLSTDWLITGAKLYFWGFYPAIGRFHFIYVFYIFYMFGAPLYSLFKHFRLKYISAQEKNRRKFMLLAFSFVLLGSVDFLPKYGVNIYPFGAVVVGLWLSLIAYATLRYRAMDIKFMFSRWMVYVFTILFGIIPAIIVIVFLQRVLLFSLPVFFLLLMAIFLGLVIAITYSLSEKLVQYNLLKTRLRYYEILRRFSNDMVRALNLQELLKKFDEVLRDALQVSSIAIYLTGPRSGRYPLRHFQDKGNGILSFLRRRLRPDNEKVPLPQQESVAPAIHYSDLVPLWRYGDALVDMAYDAKDVLVLGEMEMMARERKNEQLEEAIVQMKEAKAEVCVPFKRDGRMVGMALLGPREGDRYYSPDDLSLLHTLGQSACVAFQNALMVEEIKRTYRLLQRMQRLSAMASLASGVAHEIRNPLMPIGFLMDSVADPSVDRDLLMRLYENSKESLRRITSVLDELNELARPEPPTFEESDVNSIVDQAVERLAPQIKLKKQNIVKEYEPLPTAMVDRERLKHAVMDIVLNAIEANPDEGKIFLRTRRIVTKRTEAKPPGPGIQIEVTDTGCGIPPEHLERVFDPFFTTKHKSLLREGTGLGLAIAHRIIDEHHGSIDLRSEVDKGTSVYINLPLNQ